MNIEKFVNLIREDKERLGSELKLAQATKIKRGTIHYWLAEIKSEPKIESLETYVKNLDAPKERKKLYYEYCGYPVPDNLKTDKTPDNFMGYQSDFTTEEVAIPIVGEITCGDLTFAEINIEGYEFVLKKNITDADSHVFLRVHGDSMNMAGIVDGSLVLIARNAPADSGSIVAVIIDGEMATVKEMKIKDDIIIFSPRSTNPNHESYIYKLGSDDYKIYGVVTKIITNL